MIPKTDQQIIEINASILSTYPPIVLLVGLFFNYVSLRVWAKFILRAPVAVFMFALSILDTIALFSEPFSYWIIDWSRKKYRHALLDDCWVFVFIQNFIDLYSGWIVFFFCFVQASKLCMPDKKIISTTRAILIVLIIGIVSAIVNQHFVSYTDMRTPLTANISPFLRCSEPQEKSSGSFWVSFKWKWINRLSSCMFPVTLTMASVIAIMQIHKIYRNQNRDNEPLIIRGVCFPSIPQFQRDMNKIAMIVGITYILAVVPVTIYRVDVPVISNVKQELASTILSLFGHLNISIKFLYFYFASIDFRRDAKKVMKNCFSSKCYLFQRNRVEAFGTFYAAEEIVHLKIAEISADGAIQLEICGFGDSLSSSPQSLNESNHSFSF